LSGLAANYFFVPPTFSFTIHKSSDIANLIIFLVIGGFISKLGGVRKQANRERIKLLEQDLRTRKQLKEVRDQFFDVIENNSDGFFMVDREWRYTYVNRKGVEIVRKSKEELLRHRLWDVFPEAVKQKDYWELHRAMEESVAVHYENFSDSYNIWYEVDVYPSQEGISIFARDITERKQAETGFIFGIGVTLSVIKMGNYFALLARVQTSPTASEMNKSANAFWN
jgi:PAS domain S-box-containing protein